ncbi:MAG: HTTM domain-containing protein [Pirellula sp.]|jgi:vitamin K-dependent gamma-carboxylase
MQTKRLRISPIDPIQIKDLSLRLQQAASATIDSSSAVFFRIAFGSCICYWAWDYMSSGIVRTRYIEPDFHFTYLYLDFIFPLPGPWMYVLFTCICLLGLFVALGLCYRIASILLAVLFTYVFLLDKTNYQNHYYLISLIAWWMPFLPLNRTVAFDVWIKPSSELCVIPAWVLWVIRFHVGLPYFMGGMAKFIPDWLLGFPMGEMIASKSDLPLIGAFLAWEPLGLIMSWGGLLFDLLVVLFLLYPRTRTVAYLCCIAFHLTNSVVFNIHIFPWFMILATPIFFDSTWPKRVLNSGRLLAPGQVQSRSSEGIKQVSIGFLLFLGFYSAFHIMWPLRHFAMEGDASWHERGHYFSWRMMLRGKKVVLGFALKDPVTKQVSDGQPTRFLNPEQYERMGRDPDMILQFAHFLRDEYRSRTGQEPEVYALVLASLNGRKPALMIDPNVNLASEKRGLGTRAWVLPNTEPLIWPPWSIPPSEWRNHIEIPSLKFLKEDSNSN